MYIRICVYVYIYVYIYICLRCEREREREPEKVECPRPISDRPRMLQAFHSTSMMLEPPAKSAGGPWAPLDPKPS